MPLIRDTIDPTREREVSDEEALDLERQNVVLTGTRARTPEGLRAAAVRQVTEQLEGSAADAAPSVVIGVGEPADTSSDEDEHQDPGPDPDSTTDPTLTDSQES